MNGLYPDTYGLSLPLKLNHGSATAPVPGPCGNLSDGCENEHLIDLICLAACT